ncbi:hypothetical protein MKW98_009002 [Papaver atlanticum]|uniref:Uncharacterized protein n=1 Tax=Papaver atlanticum TaxID=357466 RepID=A0AAD4RX29_9MAGN|nr:hypothetical protein MKW98_009002 [Papaver atlanticum]
MSLNNEVQKIISHTTAELYLLEEEFGLAKVLGSELLLSAEGRSRVLRLSRINVDGHDLGYWAIHELC